MVFYKSTCAKPLAIVEGLPENIVSILLLDLW